MPSASPLRFTLLFSLSLSLAGAASSFPLRLPPISSSSGSTTPTATFSDLLSLLGPPQQATSVNPQVARRLRSCFKFLAPFNQPLPTRRSLTYTPTTSPLPDARKIDHLILSPPPSILDLARLAVDSGGDPGVIHRALDPTIIPVPDVEGSNKARCELTRTPYGWKFVDEGVNSYLEFLFEIIVKRGPDVGLNVSLSRFDFFHGHLFIAKESRRLGILFHAKEYPACDKEFFPYNMGYCQAGSNVVYDDSMNLRNILWLAPLPSNSTSAWLAPGVLVVLDAHPEGIIFQDLIPEYVKDARTLYEEYCGEVVVDVNYLNVGSQEPKFQIFIC